MNAYQSGSNRRLQIALVHKRQRPGTGSADSFVFARTARVQWPDLSAILAGIPWCVVGAVATRQYMPERTTADLDIAVCATDASAARARMQSAGLVHQGELTISGSSWRSPEGQMVDMLELEEDWAKEALATAGENRDQQGLPIISLPYLVIMKLDASRLQDIADLGRMLGQASESMLNDVRRIVRQLRPADLEDTEALIAAGRWELGR